MSKFKSEIKQDMAGSAMTDRGFAATPATDVAGSASAAFAGASDTATAASDENAYPRVNGMLFVSRKPTHPGEVLREEFMPDFCLSVASLAQHLAVSRQSANELVHERRAVSAEMALRLARVFGTTPQYWLNLQRNVDLWDSLDLKADSIAQAQPLPEVVMG